MEKITREEAKECVRKLIRYIGDDPEREGLLETPDRVINSYKELFAGYQQNTKDFMQTFSTTNKNGMVVSSNIELFSTCEHHMLPFIGHCHIGYIPDQHVVGISKLSRIMEVFARRLQIQEELTHQIATAIFEGIPARGVGVVIEARHMCMSCRGVNKQNSIMTTMAMTGCFETDLDLQQKFFQILGSQKNELNSSEDN